MPRALSVIVGLLLALAVCVPAGAGQRVKPVEDPARIARRDAAIDLVQRVVQTGIDPRRGASGVLPASRAASLAWKFDPDLGRRLFTRVLDRAEVLLGDHDEGPAVADALPKVLSNLAVRDPEAARTAVERFAKLELLAARPGERSRLLAALAAAVVETNPLAAEGLIVASFEQGVFDPQSWSAIRELETDPARRAVDAGLGALERGAPTIPNLFQAATFGQLLTFGATAELDRNGTPANVRRWLVLAVARLEAIRVAIVSARAGGGSLGALSDELAFAQFLAPAIVGACERWYPEGRETARVAANEIGLANAASGPGSSGDARPAAARTGTTEADSARIGSAYDLVREGREKEARSEIAAVVSDEARRGATDELELMLAADAMSKSQWSELHKRLANVADRSLRIHAMGAAAAALAASGVGDIAGELAGEVVRLGAGELGGGYRVAAGLVSAAIVFEALGDVGRSGEAMKLAAKVLARIDADGPGGSGCRCWPFVPVGFGTVTVSTGLRVGAEDVRLGDALGASAKRDLAGAVGLATGIESAPARELVELALVRALIAQGV